MSPVSIFHHAKLQGLEQTYPVLGQYLNNTARRSYLNDAGSGQDCDFSSLSQMKFWIDFEH